MPALAQAYALAAANARDAGFDAVAIHGAHGYLLLADPGWVNRVRDGKLDEFGGFDAGSALARLYGQLQGTHSDNRTLGLTWLPKT